MGQCTCVLLLQLVCYKSYVIVYDQRQQTLCPSQNWHFVHAVSMSVCDVMLLFGLRIQSLDPDYFQNLTGTSLSKDTSVIKFSYKSHHSLRRFKPNCGQVPYLSRNVDESFKKIPGSRYESGWLPKFNQFFLVHRYMCGKIFVRSVQ